MQLHKILNQSNPCFVSLPADAALEQAVTAMARHGKTAVVAMESGQVKGILTRTDVVGLLAQDSRAPVGEKTVSQLMSRNLVVADPQTSLAHALERMARYQIEHIPVVEAGRLLTVVHERELLHKRVDGLQTDIGVMQTYIENLHNASQD